MKNNNEVRCYNDDCEYCGDEMCKIDKTNCRIHEGYELLENDCKEFKNKKTKYKEID